MSEPTATATDALAPAAPAAPAAVPKKLVCGQCKAKLSPSDFAPRERNRLDKENKGICRSCNGKNRFLTEHGIARADYDAALERQQRTCCCCRRKFGAKIKPVVGLWPGGDQKKSRMHGIVCVACNDALKQFGTRVSGVLSVAAHLLLTYQRGTEPTEDALIATLLGEMAAKPTKTSASSSE